MKKSKKANRIKSVLIFIFAIIIIAAVVVNWFFPIYYQEYVEYYSGIYSVDKYLIYSTIKTESEFNKNAVSNKGAKGLMQIMDRTAEEMMNELKMDYSDCNLLDPKTNIQIGTYYLSKLNTRYDGDMEKVTAAYNSGFTNVDAWSYGQNFKENIEFEETKKYVEKMQTNYKVYKFLYEYLRLSLLSLPDFFVHIKVVVRNFAKYLRQVISNR